MGILIDTIFDVYRYLMYIDIDVYSYKARPMINIEYKNVRK